MTKLTDQLCLCEEYKPVKAFTKELKPFFDMNSQRNRSAIGKALVLMGEGMGKSARTIPDPQYKTIRTHHVDVIKAFIRNLKSYPEYMDGYRY